MRIVGFIWLPSVIDKIDWKHGVTEIEVEETFNRRTEFRKVEKGHDSGEDLYAALGRTRAGRYLVVFFILKRSKEALIITARDMDEDEKKRYKK